LRLIRAVKSAEEIARLERSARINVAAATEVFMGARAGTTLRDLRRRYGGAAVGI
jgi:Xaa-Pro aminopeptidase